VAGAAQVAAARAAYRVAGTIPNPTITYTHSESPPRQHLLVDQPLDWLLRRGKDRSAARYAVGSAAADSAQTSAELGREVRTAFYAARAAAAVESLTAVQLRLADSVATIGLARLRAGDISLFEAEQARAEAAGARQTLSSAREGARLASSDLARAVGADPFSSLVATGALDAGLDQQSQAPITVEGLPLVREAVADSGAAAALAQSASITRIPLPTIQAGAEWEDPTEPNTGGLAVIGIAVPLPLWQQGGGALGEARARATTAAARLREVRLDAARRLAGARIQLEESSMRARFARDTLLPAVGALRGRAVRAYQVGETGLLPVLDALRNERDAALAGVRDLLAFQTAVAEWEALVEGGS
jgi:cobalt-zinc-cadmium efflux system outer membrane protein